MNKIFYQDQIENACCFLKRQVKDNIDWCVVLGSGLGGFSERLTPPVIGIPYGDIPGFPATHVQGHSGRLVFGRLETARVAVMEGRFHYYEGHAPGTVVLPVRTMIGLGTHHFFMTNAAGGIHEDLVPGDLMMINDHLNLMGMNPLRGDNLEEFGPRFPAMTCAYDPELMDFCRKIAHEHKIELKAGVYAALAGPNYETAAEIQMLRILGADAVGMSTVPEALAIRHAGCKLVAVSLITNATGGSHVPTYAEVVEMAARRRADLHLIIQKCISGPRNLPLP